MKLRIVVLGVAAMLPLGAQNYYGAASPAKASAAREAAVALENDKVFPHMATGGTWETTLVLVNMSSAPITFDQDFYDQQGNPMSVTFRTIPDGQLITTAKASGTLSPGSSFNILLEDRGQGLQVGWSELFYDSTTARLGGFSIFRQNVPGRPSFEALVPLSSVDDFKFYMPFDNRAGFVTTMALLNSGSLPTTASLTFRNTTGTTLITDTIDLPAGNQRAFSLGERYPALNGEVGVLYVQGTSGFLSSLGFRFNSTNAFATIPIMNWAGMFNLDSVR